jgi:hypothetical protein
MLRMTEEGPFMTPIAWTILLAAMTAAGASAPENLPPLVRSAQSGPWSQAATWKGGKVPGAGARVQVRTGHVVTFDARTDGVVRSIHVGGRLRFDPQRDTRLDVGLIKIQAGDDARESGFDCENHVTAPEPGLPRPALEVGTAAEPIAADHQATIRLTAVPGLDPEECPAIVCCGGRWDVHGSPLSRAWVKLGAPAEKGSSTVKLAEALSGWRVGDRVIITATGRKGYRGEPESASVRREPQTEERIVRTIDGASLTLDKPLDYKHLCLGNHRGEVANLSRNVVIESADPGGIRGHTMYHRHSAGSISYAEFRHLGKEGKLGKYSIHFHRVGDTMRGSSVMGASIWDSANRWVTIHGTNTMVLRDCVGYGSIGHGFFLEDGTEVENILDRNLAVQACMGKPLPGQVFPLDRNEGAGFWWANCHNAFTRNVAVECDQYGYRFDAPESPGFDLVMAVRGPDGLRRKVDIRTLPFLRFDGNEAHDQRRYGLNLGGGPEGQEQRGVGGVGPDARHPLVIRNLMVWYAHWGVSPGSPSVLIDGLDLVECDFGFWHPRYDRQAYRGVTTYRTRWPEAFATGERPDEKLFPAPLDPVDDRPPVTVITRVARGPGGRVVVSGVTVDDGPIRSVRVNGIPARPLDANYLTWHAVVDEKTFPRSLSITADSVDEAGNIEKRPHRLTIEMP